MRTPDQAVDIVWVYVRAGRVAAMVFVPAPSGGEGRMIPLPTRQGVHVGMTLADVERGYGPPEARSFAAVRYGSRGVGFIQQESYVMGIAIFAPGTGPDLERMWPY